MEIDVADRVSIKPRKRDSPMRSRLIPGLLAIAFIMATSACGSGGSAGSDNAAKSPVAATQCHVAAPDKPTTVNMYGWTFPVMDFYAAELKSCGDVENIDVNTQLLDSTTVEEGVRLALSSGGKSPYDIVHLADNSLVEFGLEGWLLPMDDLIKKYSKEYALDGISKKAWEGATVGGHVYGIPMSANTFVLAYRSDLFKKYNLQVPTTYDEVIKACDVLKNDPSIDVPFAMDVSAGWAWEIEFFHALRSFGGDFLNKDGTPAFNGPQGVAAAEKVQEVVKACMGDKLTSYGYEANEVGMNTGAVAFTNIWAANTASMSDPKSSKFANEIKFAPAPAPNPGGPLAASAWHDYYTIPATVTNDPDLIFRLIMETADVQSQQGAAKLGLPTRQNVISSLPSAGAALTSIDKGVGIYAPVAGTSLVRTALANWLPLIGQGGLSVQAALDSAAKEYTDLARSKGIIK